VAAIGTGDAFSKGRDFGAWLGLVPKLSRPEIEQSVAIAICAPCSSKHWERYGLKSWIEAANKRLHHNVLAIALANKLARMAWSVLAHGRTFEVSKIQAA
jgi:transposase